MKNNFMKTMCALIIMIVSVNIRAQPVSDFENLALQPNSYWNGSSQPMGTNFSSGNGEFLCYYDSSFGGFWSSGWAYSNMTDTSTSGFLNQYSARTGSGFSGSANYIVGQQNAFAQAYPIVKLTGSAAGNVVDGFYVTNATYPYLSMRDGDSFGKKFGSPNGANGNPDGTNGEDWFLLTIKKWHNGVLGSDSVNFYLADFRFANNAQDYIVDTWEWVGLTSLGNADSLLFTLSSSDAGQFGMNTPAFFCLDNLTTSDVAVAIAATNNSINAISIYPNPAIDLITVNSSKLNDENITVRVFDNIGRLMHEQKSSGFNSNIAVSHFEKGLYQVVISGDEFSATKSFIKQ